MIKTKQILDRTLITLSSLLLIAMVALSVWQVVSRYVLNISSPGTEELTRFMLIWFGLMTAAYVFGAKKHIGILFFREKFGAASQQKFENISDVIILVTVSLLMIYGGVKIVMLTSAQTAAATGISMGYVYAALPVSGVFIVIYTIYNLLVKKSEEIDEVNG